MEYEMASLVEERRNDPELQAHFEKDWGDGLRLTEIMQRPWEGTYRLHFVTRDGAKFSMVLDPMAVYIANEHRPHMSGDEIITEALKAMV